MPKLRLLSRFLPRAETDIQPGVVPSEWAKSALLFGRPSGLSTPGRSTIPLIYPAHLANNAGSGPSARVQRAISLREKAMSVRRQSTVFIISPIAAATPRRPGIFMRTFSVCRSRM